MIKKERENRIIIIREEKEKESDISANSDKQGVKRD